MTVELQIPFGNNQFACEFMDYLKENGCDSKMGLAFDENATVVYYEAPISVMEAFFGAVETSGEDIPFREKKIRAVRRGRAWIAGMKAGIDLLYEKCEPGVEYAEYEDIREKVFGIDMKILTCNDCGGNEAIIRQQEDLNRKFSSASQALWVLNSNGCVCRNSETKTVTFLGPAKPFGDLTVCTSDVGIFGCFLPEELETAGIHVNQDQTLDIISVVCPEPAFVRMDLEKILEHFNDELDTDPDIAEILRIYAVLIRCVRDTVNTTGITSGELKEKMLRGLDENGLFSENPDEDVQMILDSMFQAGCIIFEDGNIRLGK